MSVATEFITLREALGESGAVSKLNARKLGSTKAAIMKQHAIPFATKMLDMQGERYNGGWAASADTCKRMGYATIIVTIEEFDARGSLAT